MRRIASLLLFLAASAVLFMQQTVAQQPAATTQEIAQEVLDAEAAITQSNWQAASDKLTPYIAAHPADARALFDAAYAADALNHLDQAADLYRRSIAAGNNSFPAHLSLGLLLARQNKTEEAHTELTAATKLSAGPDSSPDNAALKARAFRALAQIDRSTDPSAASQDLIEALKLSSETPDDTLLAAQLAEQSNDLDSAEAAYRRLLAKDPKSQDAATGLAHILIAQKKYPEAETLLRSALAAAPDDPILTAQLAAVLAAQNKAEAIPLLQKLHTSHPDNPAITRMLAEVLAEAGDTAASDQLYTQLLAASPQDPDLLVAHGQNLIRQLHYAEAYQVFTQATAAAPSNPDAWSGLAFAASKTNRHAQVIQALDNRAKFLPDNPSTYFLRATSYDAMHDRKNAATWYHRFLNEAKGAFPDQEWQAKQRLAILDKK